MLISKDGESIKKRNKMQSLSGARKKARRGFADSWMTKENEVVDQLSHPEALVAEGLTELPMRWCDVLRD